MDGVNIISAITYRGTDMFELIITAIFAIFAVFVIMKMCWTLDKDNKTVTMIGRILSILVSIGALATLAVEIARYNDIKVKYEVTIDDTVKFNEFSDTYEILETNGDVYTVRFID